MNSAEEFKFIKPGEVRTRLAPSPTGFLHIGTARAALFNYLFAQKYQGRFVLRIEDTDKERSKPEYEKDIMDGLKWLGIDWQEGPDIGGDFGPYRQSERTDIYQPYLKKLLKEDKAYHCFCSSEELEDLRQYQMSIGEVPKYSGKCADLSKTEVKKCLAEKKKSVIRLRVKPKKVIFDDLIRGKVEFDAGLLGDIVIAKDDSEPLYNFAVVVDDFEMKISHVIRGEDHISNTPKQILLQEALGLPAVKYAHLPLILGPDRSKLSKRHGAVSVLEYKKEGYLPEAIVNFMAFLGWNPGTDKEIYSIHGLVKDFSLDGVQKGGAVFNMKRLDFLNGFYIRQKGTDKLTELCLPYLMEKGLIAPVIGESGFPEKYVAVESREEVSFEMLKKIISINQERMKKISEISELTSFFFKEKLNYDKELLRWVEMENREVAASLDRTYKVLSKIDEQDFTEKNLEEILLEEAQKFGRGDRGKLLWPLRVALSGQKASTGPFEIADILGKEKVLARIKEAIKLIK